MGKCTNQVLINKRVSNAVAICCEMNKLLAYFHGGYAKHLCTQSACSQGFAVRSLRPYPLIHIRAEGEPMRSVVERYLLFLSG